MCVDIRPLMLDLLGGMGDLLGGMGGVDLDGDHHLLLNLLLVRLLCICFLLLITIGLESYSSLIIIVNIGLLSLFGR